MCLVGKHSYQSRYRAYGNLIFLSAVYGHTSRHEKATLVQQIFTCMQQISNLLSEIKVSFENIVKLSLLLKDTSQASISWECILNYFDEFNSQLKHFPPAVTFFQVEAFPEPECLIGIDVIVVQDIRKTGWQIKKIPNQNPGCMRISSESVSVGNLVFLSGINGLNSENGDLHHSFESQWRNVLEKVKNAMHRAGSSLDNIIKTLHFQCPLESEQLSKQGTVSHSPYSDRLWKVELNFYDEHAPTLLENFPASTFIKVSKLTKPSVLGQIDIVGVIDKSMKDWEVKHFPTFIGRRGFPRHIGEIKKYYSSVVKVGPLLFISGQTATDIFSARIESSLFEDQALTALSNLKITLDESDSNLNHLLKTNILIPDPEKIDLFRKIEKQFFLKHAPHLIRKPPASTVINPVGLASSSMLIEIEAIGFLSLPSYTLED